MIIIDFYDKSFLVLSSGAIGLLITLLTIRNIEILRQTVKQERSKYPFYIDAWVVLPDHIHCLWEYWCQV
jgi:hypothetical protein